MQQNHSLPRGLILTALVLSGGACLTERFSGGGGNGGGAGGLDESFGQSGLVTTALSGTDDEAHGMAVLPDGRAVLAGEARPDARSLRGFALVRYLPNGAPDPNFGRGGRVFTAFSESWGSGARAVTAQPDGRLVAVGYARHPERAHDTFAVARYNSDGSLDTSFGEGGGVITAVDAQTGAGRNDIARAVALDRNGRIVVVGETGGAFKDIAVVRYNPDGTLDTSFGDGGGVVTDLGGNDGANAVAVQLDGRIVVGGSGWRQGSGAEDFVVVRYNPDGTLDASFGAGGVATTDFRGGSDRGESLVVEPDGRIVVGGVAQLGGGCSPRACERYGLAVARYTSDGRPDASFGDGGKVALELLTSAGGYGLTRLADGHLALAGHLGNEDFGVALFRSNGALETGFGESGILRTSFGTGTDRAVAAGALSDGAFLVGGVATVGNGWSFALARYQYR
jgi:uncharacterized delta-60 repeat protein